MNVDFFVISGINVGGEMDMEKKKKWGGENP